MSVLGDSIREEVLLPGERTLAQLMVEEQPNPTGDGASVHDALIGWLTGDNFQVSRADLIWAVKARKRIGVQRYGVPLRAHNGRSTVADLAQELLDALVYAQQGCLEYTGVDSDIEIFFQECRLSAARRLTVLSELLKRKTGDHWRLSEFNSMDWPDGETSPSSERS